MILDNAIIKALGKCLPKGSGTHLMCRLRIGDEPEFEKHPRAVQMFEH
jgi:hypothetical protein